MLRKNMYQFREQKFFLNIFAMTAEAYRQQPLIFSLKIILSHNAYMKLSTKTTWAEAAHKKS